MKAVHRNQFHRSQRACEDLLILLLITLPIVAVAQGPFVATNALRRDFWDTDGNVNAVLATNGTVYVGGLFSYVAPKGRKVAAYDAYTGEALPEFPRIFGAAIRVIIHDGNGGWFIGGSFNEVGGLPRTNLVHILADQSVDPDFYPNPNALVRALALDGGTLYVGGDFNSIAGQTRQWLAALTLATGALTTWAPESNDYVSALLVAGNTIYVGGRFSQIGGRAQSYLAAVDAGSGSASNWNLSLDGEVLTLGLLENRLFIGGNFNLAGGSFNNGLAAIDVTTGHVTSWNPGPVGGKVAVLRVACNTVYVGGYFTNIAGVPRSRVAAIDATSGLATDWNAGLGLFRAGTLPSSILTLELSGNSVYLGGEFKLAGGESRRDLIAVDSASGRMLAWNPGADGGVRALGVAGRTLVAGFVNGPGGVERRNLAAFDELTGRVTDWRPEADGEVFALAVHGGAIFAGGQFANAGGALRNRLAAIEADSGQALANWSADANETVRALAVTDGRLFAGGQFTTIGGQTRWRLAALDVLSGAIVLNWVAHADSTVHALAAAGDRIYAGGSFSSIGGLPRRHLAALAATDGQVLPWNPDAGSTGDARALTVSGDTIYAGGSFLFSIGNQPRAYLAAIDSVSGAATLWNPGADQEVRALAVSGDIVYAAGFFTQIGGQPRTGLAVVDSNGATAAWNPGSRDTVENHFYALGLSEGGLFVGGRDGLAFDTSPSTHSFAAFPRVGAPVILIAPRDQRVAEGGSALFRVAAAGDPPLHYQWRYNGAELAGETNATLALTNLQAVQSGNYQVVVANNRDTVTAEGTLLILVPVSFIAQPVSQTTNAGETMTLSVGAIGHPPPIYQWRLNGVNIPGAVYPTLTLSNITPQSGGSYYVAAANSSGATSSDLAIVIVTSPALPFADVFAGRGEINGVTGIGSGSNVATSRETNELRHAGKPGGSSIWLKWVAPVSGFATFNTRGSTFDTLLGIYTNTSLTNLATVASGEDGGGFLTSRASFNAGAGVEYQIAVDGFAGATGHVVLSWELEVGAPESPRITADPQSQTVATGETAVFSVSAVSATSLQFQWYFGCQALPGATNDVLVLTNIGPRQVGFYHVVAGNASGRVAESLPAALELGPIANARSFEKLEDLVDALNEGPPSGGGGAFAAASAGFGSSPLLVSLGSITSQLFSTSTNGPSRRQITDCGVIGGPSAWLAFTQAQHGFVLVDTIGSQFDTVLSVYTKGAGALDIVPVGCDDNSAPDGVRSQFGFPGVAQQVCLAWVSGVGGAKGAAQLNLRLGLPPSVFASNSMITAGYRTNLLLDAGVGGADPEPTFQWRWNGIDLLGETNSGLVLTNLQPDRAGIYSVVVRNFAGVVTNVRATLTVDVPLQLDTCRWLPGGQFACRLLGNSGTFYVLRASPDLQSWSDVQTGRLWTGAVTFVDANATSFRHRFYRIVPSPAPP